MRVFLLLLVATLAAADIPVECHFSDILGDWTFFESARNGTADMSCDAMGEWLMCYCYLESD